MTCVAVPRRSDSCTARTPCRCAPEDPNPACARVVTIGTPHRGTWLGRFSHTSNGRQMRLEGDWVRALAQERPPVPFTCWSSNCDNVVFPASAATLPGADNRMLRGVAHVELAFEPQVFAHALELLRQEG